MTIQASAAVVAPIASAHPINRKYFFDRVRHALFGGRLEMWQVDGLTRILDYRDANWPGMPDEELAYLLATVKHETAHTMQPISERGGEKYLRSKPYYPYYGRGLVQITWLANYKKFGVVNKDDALGWPKALDIAFRGMIFGMFTGNKLADYIRGGKRDYTGARRIINGTDRAKLIAGYAESFLDALTQSREQR
jgi:putative chitinase